MGLLDKAGTQTTGEVERTYSTSGRGRTNYVTYRFVDGHGVSHVSDQLYPYRDWGSLGPGAPISVTYLTDDPEQNDLTLRVQLLTDRSPTGKMVFIGAPWIISGCFFFGYWVRRRRI